MGIHSLSKPSDAKIIFAANSFLTNYVNGFLQANGIKNSPCVGSYQGILENSWIVNYDQLSKIKHLLINEQSILLLDQPNSRNELKATLIFLDEKTSDLEIGYLRSVSKEEAMKRDAWTSYFMLQENGSPIETFFVCYHNDKFGDPIK